MKIYLVGGAVRDKLLGLPVTERDWVVVGATVADMLKLGYRQVGKEFPVFLHPKTNEEYALARLERKVKPGYQGFTFDTSPQVSLADDLIRRDLTINAMAESPEGELIDPHHGQQDIKDKILRHVSPAFSEDPVRILRVGRLLARYFHLGFQLAPDTLTLMRKMVAAGEVNALVPERVWKEWERALGEKNPEQFFVVLQACEALPILFPHITQEGNGIAALKIATTLTDQATIRFAVLLHDLPNKNAINELCDRYRLPNYYRELALLTAAFSETAFTTKTLSADALVTFFSQLDIYRRLPRFEDFVLACTAIAKSKKIAFDPAWLTEGAQVARSVDVQALLAQGIKDQALAAKLKEKRAEKIEHWLKMSSGKN